MSAAITVAYIFERYPVLTQTFLRRELAGLSGQALRLEIHSMLSPDSDSSCRRLQKLPDCIPIHYFRWWEAMKLVLAMPREVWRDPALLRDGWRLCRQYRFNNWENFTATVWAVIFAFCRAPDFRRRKPDVVHGVRATGPATAAAILSRLCGIPFSFGGHAYDIYRHDGDAFLEPKLRAAGFVHTTTQAAKNYLRQHAGGAAVKIVLARRGLESLPPKMERVAGDRPIALLSVGRLVPKKGHVHQIAACALLKSWGISFAAQIIGDGPLREELQRKINQAGLRDSVTLCGALSPEKTDDAYRWADIFWHTGVVDAEGDRDGLPNVIPEAFAHSLPVIANNLPGTTEAVANGVNGLVVEVADAAQLAGAVKRLAENLTLRQTLGENGRRWVEEHFLISRNSETLARAFAEAAVNTRPSV
ncbi:MAG: glycosyl transferase family 1 [Pedosphaera sp.]|nr:glycosyl transferase family 1 [Pedosphaera sp.]